MGDFNFVRSPLDHSNDNLNNADALLFNDCIDTLALHSQKKTHWHSLSCPFSTAASLGLTASAPPPSSSWTTSSSTTSVVPTPRSPPFPRALPTTSPMYFMLPPRCPARQSSDSASTRSGNPASTRPWLRYRLCPHGPGPAAGQTAPAAA